MKILIACEFSGIVREAFKAKGHDAWSCDLLPTEIPGQHIQGDVLAILDQGWDLMIAHPPCNDLAVSGAAHFAKKRADGRQQRSIDFFYHFTKLHCAWAIENPVGIMSRLYRKPDQIIQPWFFGDSYHKTTCLWLHNLPLLQKTNVVDRGEFKKYSDGTNRAVWFNKSGGNHPRNSKYRSRTFPGIANAMADQWG